MARSKTQLNREHRQKARLSALGEEALKWARSGHAVFPCKRRGKTPLTKHGYKDATTSKKTIRRRWGRCPEANIGLRTGGDCGLLVLDVDGAKGRESLRRLEAEYGALADTWVAITGRGRHFYFAMPSDGPDIRISAGKLGPRLDVRGTGGYVIVPPSVHKTGNIYEWAEGLGPDDVDLADAPEWLVELLTKGTKRQQKSPDGWRKLAAEGASEGKRNDSIARLAGHLLRHRVDPVETLDLCQAWNAYRCRPPLEEDEVARTVLSIAKHEMSARGSSDE